MVDERTGEDARVKLLALTHKGEAAITDAAPHWRQAQAEFAVIKPSTSR